MRRRIFAASLVLLAAGGATSVDAQAAPTPKTAPVQSACYVPGSGTIYRVKAPSAPAQCASGHVEFQLATGADANKPGPFGGAGGDLAGTYPNPKVVGLNGHPVVNNAGAFDFSNVNGLVSVGTSGTGALPVSGPGTRLMWVPARRAFRAGSAFSTEWDLASLGDGSVAIGIDGTASGQASVALGNIPTASGAGAIAIGSSAQATGVQATALGPGTVASGTQSAAIGSNSKAVNDLALAFGNSAFAQGTQSVAIGNGVFADGTNSTVIGQSAGAGGKTGAFVYGDASTTNLIQALVANQFVARAQQFWLGTTNSVTATAGRFLETSTGAYLTSGGAWTNSSDVNRKHEFMRVDGDDVLAKLAAMPVQTWSYRTEDPSVRHMGPTAQDFRKAFGLGDTDKAIATVDADGVSLAGIKALVVRTAQLQRDNADLRAAVADLQRRLLDLELTRR